MSLSKDYDNTSKFSGSRIKHFDVKPRKVKSLARRSSRRQVRQELRNYQSNQEE